MERIQKLIRHPLYLEYTKSIREWEKDRPFCKHDYVHFLNVARLAMIIKLKEQIDLSEELIYGAALLHDIGRHVQYETGKDHAIVSSELAPKILKESGYNQEETDLIVEAVRNHRNEKVKEEKNLKGILYRADKLSRECYFCEAEPLCHWKNKKKNKELVF
ncbi:MAG: HD domain-containing protein [Lachnospiraceae bacterium]|nr:HD domain-containing protein [Lachnospiraceae bacterium]